MSEIVEQENVVYHLGHDMELRYVPIEVLREQDVNARAMSKEAFERLAGTINRDNRMESLPFCADVDHGDGKIVTEIVSGHHRVRAARTALMSHIWVLVDTSGLTRDQIKAKQLAHNSLQGEDDPQLVKQIFDSIQDLDARLEAYIDPDDLDIELEPVPDMGLRVDYGGTAIYITFLPYEKETFSRALEAVKDELKGSAEAAYLAEQSVLDEFRQMLLRAGQEYEVKAIGTTLAKCAQIVLEHLGEDPGDSGGVVALRDLFGTSYVPDKSAETIEKAIKKAVKDGEITRGDRWQLLEYLAADYTEARTGVGS